ncbi:MAG: hypothetical protein KKD86_07320 [Bacteroidetes bacterium]|nr:hypothetical protein [Bacteroidota bacterium]
MDFTIVKYKQLLKALQKINNNFISFGGYFQSPNQSINQSSIILRHDVDLFPQNSLQMAQLEYSLGINGTYYFRVVPESDNLEKMDKIAELGYEIGYHYEDIDLVVRKIKVYPVK